MPALHEFWSDYNLRIKLRLSVFNYAMAETVFYILEDQLVRADPMTAYNLLEGLQSRAETSSKLVIVCVHHDAAL